jgi:hypothetical protein
MQQNFTCIVLDKNSLVSFEIRYKNETTVSELSSFIKFG